MPAVVALSTFPSKAKAAEILRILVEERLCACANLVPAVRSIYRWQDEICDEPEALAIIKTTSERVDALRLRIVALHPYDVPEVIVLPIEGGHAAYLAWLAAT